MLPSVRNLFIKMAEKYKFISLLLENKNIKLLLSNFKDNKMTFSDGDIKIN